MRKATVGAALVGEEHPAGTKDSKSAEHAAARAPLCGRDRIDLVMMRSARRIRMLHERQRSRAPPKEPVVQPFE